MRAIRRSCRFEPRCGHGGVVERGAGRHRHTIVVAALIELDHAPRRLAERGHLRDGLHRVDERGAVPRQLRRGCCAEVSAVGRVGWRHVFGRQIEHVVVLLVVLLRRDARLLEEVSAHVRARHPPCRVEVEREELAEAGAVVVAHRLGTAKRLHDRVGLQHPLILRVGHRLGAAGRRVRSCEVLEQDLGGLRLARAGFARDDDHLRRRALQHAEPRGRCNRVHVRRQFCLRVERRLVLCKQRRCVERQLPKRVHGEQQPAAARVDVARIVPRLCVVEEGVVVDRRERGELGGARAEVHRERRVSAAGGRGGAGSACQEPEACDDSRSPEPGQRCMNGSSEESARDTQPRPRASSRRP
eukprot:2470925-Prymnesium_polylepis.4